MINGSAIETPRQISVQDFRGDFDAVAGVLQRSWSENNKQALLYTSQFVASCFEYPGASFSLAPTLYEGINPIAFIAGFPRRLLFKGRELRVVINTFLSVSNEYKRKGYGIVLWSELVKRAQAAGFDGMVNYCVDGEAMDGMILGCCRMMKLPTERIFSVPYQMRLLMPKKVSQPKTNLDGVVDAFMSAASRIAEQTPFARIWNQEEAEWQCRRQGAVIAQHSQGLKGGILTGYIMEIANPQRTKCLLVEDVLWGNLEKDERLSLVHLFLDQAIAAGAQMATVPCLGYADMEPFRAAKFRFSSRVLHAYLTIFSGEPAPEPVPAMYLDVF